MGLFSGPFWVIYDKAGGSFVKQVTPGRFSLRQGRSEQSATSGLVMGSVDTGSGKDRRWVSDFNHGNRGSLCGQQSPGGREMAKGCGSRCWSRPWKNFPGPISAACPAIRRCWWRYARSWRGRCHLARMAHPVSACEIRLGKIRLRKKPHLSNSDPANPTAQASFAGDLQPRLLATLDPAQLGLLTRDVVARHRHNALPLVIWI